MTHLNTALFAISLLLQLLLVITLLRTGTARRVPTFTALVAFYLLRSILLFSLFAHLAAATYGMAFNTLAMLDLALQVAVAWELFRAIDPRGPARSLALFTLLAALAAVFAWELSRLLPRNVRNPPDRGVLFIGILMIAIALASTRGRLLRVQHRILQGLAALGLLGILSQVGRALAVLHRDAPAFRRWSYVEPTAYVLTLLFWLLSLYARVRPFASNAPAPPQPANLPVNPPKPRNPIIPNKINLA